MDTAWWLLVACGVVVSVAASVLMARYGRVMRRHGGKGIVAFELARDAAATTAIRDAWGDEGRAAARRSLLVDFAFIASYVLVPVLVADAAADTLHREGATAWAGFARVFGWGFAVAGALDVAENVLLLKALSGGVPGWLPKVARPVARLKFALTYAGVPLLLTAVFAAAAP